MLRQHHTQERPRPRAFPKSKTPEMAADDILTSPEYIRIMRQASAENMTDARYMVAINCINIVALVLALIAIQWHHGFVSHSALRLIIISIISCAVQSIGVWYYASKEFTKYHGK